MGYKRTIGKTNWVLGEISPRLLGRFDQDKPIYKNGAAIIENFLIAEAGSLVFRPGTQFIAEVKDSTKKVCFYRFTYSLNQEYVLEVGNQYIRFFANGGQVIVASVPLEISTVFLQADIFNLQTANKADVMYI